MTEDDDDNDGGFQNGVEANDNEDGGDNSNDGSLMGALRIEIICTIVGAIVAAAAAKCCDSRRPPHSRRLPLWFHYIHSAAYHFLCNMCHICFYCEKPCNECCTVTFNSYAMEHPLHRGTLAPFGNVKQVDEALFVEKVSTNSKFEEGLRHHGLNTPSGENLAPALRHMFASIVNGKDPPLFDRARWKEWLKDTYDSNAVEQHGVTNLPQIANAHEGPIVPAPHIDPPDTKRAFDAMDRNGTGIIRKNDFINALNKDQNLRSFFGLPGRIKQHGGCQDKAIRIFNYFSKNGDNFDRKDWTTGIDNFDSVRNQFA